MKSSRLLAITAAASAVLSTFPASAGLVDNRAAFEAAISGDTIDGFEGRAEGTYAQVTPLSMFTNTASLSGLGGGQVIVGEGSPPVDATKAPGRSATEGTNWWDSGVDFTITFDSAVEAFGIDITDLNDFSADNCTPDSNLGIKCSGLTVKFYSDNAMTQLIQSVDISGDLAGGNQKFVGYYADGAAIKVVSFTNHSDGNDGVGYDKATIGSVDTPSQVPEPTTLLLAVTSLSLMRRRVRRASKM